jgi:hypothetical protein
MSKRVALLLFVILTVSSLIVVKPAPAVASIPKPSVPEFTVKLVDHSYDVPTTSSIDPYTGQNVSHPGYHVENYTIDVTIKNQPFVPTDAGGWNTTFYYNVRFKGHYSQDWMTAYSPYTEYPKQSNSTHTVLTYTHSSDDEYVLGGIMTQIHPGAQVDFQVQALIGAVHRGYNANATNQLDMFPWVFDGETSDWSNTQTITIDTNASTSTPNASPSQNSTTSTTDQSGNQPAPKTDFYGIAVTAVIVIIVIALLTVGTMLVRRKNRKTNTNTPQNQKLQMRLKHDNSPFTSPTDQPPSTFPL